MAIILNSSNVQIGPYFLCETPTGLYFSGKFAATKFNSVNQFLGTSYGYTSGGAPKLTCIDKFPFATDSNATLVGGLTQGRHGIAGQSSSVHGYSSGGYIGPPGTAFVTTIDKFPFFADSSASSVGNLCTARYYPSGQSSNDSGFSSGGNTAPGISKIVDKYPFAADGTATGVGSLVANTLGSSGQSSDINGYASGGFTPPYASIINKFPFSAPFATATNIGSLSQGRYGSAGTSSTTNGYSAGGTTGSDVGTIDKFPFSTNSGASSVGCLTVARNTTAGQSSNSFGYTTGGFNNVIDKFPFSTDQSATDVGDLICARGTAAGQQH